MNTKLRTCIAGLALALLGGVTQAGGFSQSANQTGSQLNFSPEQIVGFAKRVERVMAMQGARVAILARMGRPVADLPEGMRFTHVGFAVYSEVTTVDGRKLPGYAIYNLYQLDSKPNTSKLEMDFPADFFSGVAQLEAGIIIPSAELQQRLLGVINSPTYASLHDPRYSLIANPFTLGKQNCTEFVLDVVQAALYQTGDITAIKLNTKNNFVAQRVHVNPVKLLIGSWLNAEISTSDQPGVPLTATFEKIGEYLKRYDPSSQILTITAD